MTRRNRMSLIPAAAAACLMLAGVASANPIEIDLTDLNATVHLDLTDGAGMDEWVVDGVDHLNTQWFYYRIGGGATAPIHSLPLLSRSISDGNFNPGDDRVVVAYGDAVVRITVDFSLTGGAAGTGAAAIDEVITVLNMGASPLDVTLYQYADFDLGGTAADDSVRITGGNTASQTAGSSYVAESVVTSSPDHSQADVKDGVDDILYRIGAGSDLSDAAGPVGPGDLAWAFQWDATLDAGEALIISKKKNVVPEPGTVALILLGGVAALRRRRR